MPDFVYIPHFLLQAESHTQLCAVTFQLSQQRPREEQAAPEICKKRTLKRFNTADVVRGLEWELLPEHKALAEPQQHRNWEQILAL